jgi:TPR repeat protein
MAADHSRAYRLFRKLAIDGSSRNATWKVGYCLDHGYGVTKNKTAAVEWYLKAALEDDVAEAMHNLGMSYLCGDGVATNLTLAASWFTKAAQWGRDEWVEIEDGVSALKSRGVANAQFMLGMMYMEGKGVGEDLDVGMDYLHLAADQLHRCAGVGRSLLVYNRSLLIFDRSPLIYNMSLWTHNRSFLIHNRSLLICNRHILTYDRSLLTCNPYSCTGMPCTGWDFITITGSTQQKMGPNPSSCKPLSGGRRLLTWGALSHGTIRRQC